MKKVLIVTYYWPPAGGGGVQRWLKFAKYLPQYNIQPVVAIPDNPEYPITDKSLEKDVSADIELIKIPIWEPYKLFKLFTSKNPNEKVNAGLLNSKKKKSTFESFSMWLRGNVLIPDARVFWVRPAVRKIIRYLKTNHVDAIITTGPPHSVHLIGLRIKKRTGIKWLADFRDPWSEIDYLQEFNPSRFAMLTHKRLERKVLSKSDQVITVSNNWAEDLKRLGAPIVSVITNGYDNDDFKGFNYNYKSDQFVFLYSGMLHEYRNPSFLWNILNKLCETNKDFANKFHLKFYGTIDPGVFKQLDNLPYIANSYSFGGYINHNELLKEYEKASVLLLIQNDTKNALGHIPGKVFEYIATGKKILGVGNPNGDIAKILVELQLGEMIHSESKEDDVSSFILNCLNSKENNNPNIKQNSNVISYSRSELTRKLSDIIGE